MAILPAAIDISHGLPQQASLYNSAIISAVTSNPEQANLKALSVLAAEFIEASQVHLLANCFNEFSQSYFQNYLSSFARFFGVNARQDLNNVYINKADLIGLKPRANNTAESLLVALLLRIKDCESNDLISRVIVELFKQEIIIVNNVSMVQTVILVKFCIQAKYYYLGVSNSDQPITPNNILD